DWMVSAAYMGNQNAHLWYAQALNPSIFFPGVADTNGNCFAKGYTLRTAPGAVCSSVGNQDARRPLNLEKPLERYANVAQLDDGGNCEGDRRHIFNLTGVVESPQFSGRILRTIGSGWRLSGIYAWFSGSVVNVIAGNDRALTAIKGADGMVLQRGNQISPNAY